MGASLLVKALLCVREQSRETAFSRGFHFLVLACSLCQSPQVRESHSAGEHRRMVRVVSLPKPHASYPLPTPDPCAHFSRRIVKLSMVIVSYFSGLAPDSTDDLSANFCMISSQWYYILPRYSLPQKSVKRVLRRSHL
jgi:hypothetical protein